MSHARTQAACGTRHGERRLAPPSACGRARLPAFHLRFSPAGLSSRGLSSGPGFPKAARKLRRAARTVSGHSDAPRTPVVVPAGMMPEPPGCGPYLSARGRRTRSAVREYPPGRRPLKSEISRRYCHRRGEVKRVAFSLMNYGASRRAAFSERRSTPMILWWRPNNSSPRLRARSPTGVPLAVLASGTFVPRAQRRARLPENGAKAAACRTHRFRSQRCTSRAGRSAGRHDARAARVRTVSTRPISRFGRYTSIAY